MGKWQFATTHGILVNDMDLPIYYVAWSSDPDIRHRASSGGVGSALVKMLFETKAITASLSFKYNAESLRYTPTFVKNFRDYSITGSIYQDNCEIYQFYNDHLTQENLCNGPVLVFALPCQVRAIRALAKKRDIALVVIGLVCSSQQSMEATDYLLRRENIDKSDVKHLQYRGNGWPSGIQISLKNGHNRFVPNNDSIWTRIFHSRLFIPKRCFLCQDTLNQYADIVIADPWLKRYVEEECEGKTFVAIRSAVGLKVFRTAVENNSVICEDLSSEDFITAQQMTIDRKESYRRNLELIGFIAKVFTNGIYRWLVLHSVRAFSFHEKMRNRIEQKMLSNAK